METTRLISLLVIILWIVFEVAMAALVVRPRNNTVAILGAGVQFKCATNIRGSPIFWMFQKSGHEFKNDIYTDGNLWNENFTITMSAEDPYVRYFILAIKEVKMEDAGMYVCIDNDGRGENAISNLVVIPTRIQKSQNNNESEKSVEDEMSQLVAAESSQDVDEKQFIPGIPVFMLMAVCGCILVLLLIIIIILSICLARKQREIACITNKLPESCEAQDVLNPDKSNYEHNLIFRSASLGRNSAQLYQHLAISQYEELNPGIVLVPRNPYTLLENDNPDNIRNHEDETDSKIGRPIYVEIIQ